MPRIRRPSREDEDKRFINEWDVKAALISAIFNVMPDEEIDRIWENVEESERPLDLVRLVRLSFEQWVDDIVEDFVLNLARYSIKEGKRYQLYYQDPSSKEEVYFDSNLPRSLFSDNEDEEERALNKAKDFIKEVFGSDDLAEAFAYVFIEYITASPTERYEKFTPEYEKEEGEERAKKWEKEFEKEKEEREWEKSIFEREPTMKELRRIEETEDIDEDEDEFIEPLDEEDTFEPDAFEEDLDDFLPTDVDLGFHEDEEEEEEEYEEDDEYEDEEEDEED
jgi:hypothetical protein